MDETKLRFAAALRKLMEERPFAKVSVGEIAKEAGLSRKAFYDHFIDKDDLFNWMCYQEFLKVKDNIFEGDLWDSLLNVAKVLESEPFYREGLASMGQNAFGQYASDMFYELFHDTLAAGFRSTIDNEEGIEILVGGVVEVCRMALVLWLHYPEPQPAEKFVEFLRRGADAFSLMLCADRATRQAVPVCDYCIDHLAQSWSASPNRDSVDAVPPEREGQVRGKVEQALRAYRGGNSLLQRTLGVSGV